MIKPTIKIAVTDWWDKSTQEEFMHENCILKLLSSHYHFVYDSKPDFLLYSVFGNDHLKYEHPCIKIFYTGENIRTNWNLCDYALSFDFLEFGKRHLYFPLFVLPYYLNDTNAALSKHVCNENILKEKSKFCAFMVSNRHANPIRDEMFEQLSRYKRVDSGGRWLNNIGQNISGADDFPTSKYHWLKDYKFNICFENSSSPGYVTEKIIQAFRAQCVPIYWGDPTLCDETYSSYRPTFNPKAFINVHNFASLDEVIREIERIDKDDEVFLQMLQEPLLLDIPSNKQWIENVLAGGGEYLYLNKLLEFFKPIFENPQHCNDPYALYHQISLRQNKDYIVLQDYRRKFNRLIPKPLRHFFGFNKYM